MGIYKVDPRLCTAFPVQLVKNSPLIRPASVTWPCTQETDWCPRAYKRVPGTQAGRSSKEETADLHSVPCLTPPSVPARPPAVPLVSAWFSFSPSCLLSLSFPLFFSPLHLPGFPKCRGLWAGQPGSTVEATDSDRLYFLPLTVSVAQSGFIPLPTVPSVPAVPIYVFISTMFFFFTLISVPRFTLLYPFLFRPETKISMYMVLSGPLFPKWLILKGWLLNLTTSVFSGSGHTFFFNFKCSFTAQLNIVVKAELYFKWKKKSPYKLWSAFVSRPCSFSCWSTANAH